MSMENPTIVDEFGKPYGEDNQPKDKQDEALVLDRTDKEHKNVTAEEASTQKNLLELLDKARQGSGEHEEVYWHVFGSKVDDKYPSSLTNRADLLAKFAVGKNGEPYQSTRDASHDLIEYLANEAEGKIRDLSSEDKPEKLKPEPESERESEPTTPETTKVEPEPPVTKEEETKPEEAKPEPPKESEKPPLPPTPESVSSLGDLRDQYLKAKRLRGNVFKGTLGRFFGRRLDFGGKDMDFGGKEGAQDLEKIRREYQERLNEYRSVELTRFTAETRERLTRGEITEDVGRFEIKRKMIDLLAQEDRNIDERSVEGIERNRLEKLKTKWRQFGKTRLVTGALLGGAAATGGTALIAASAAWGTVGTYTGVEAGLERYSKAIGHKSGLVSRISQEKRIFVTEDGLDRYIFALPEEEVRKEAARLRMLQVEKGVAIENLKTLGDDGAIAEMIIRRDNQITAREALNSSDTAGQLSARLAQEVNLRNEAVESEVDRESWNKMKRKIIAGIAGGLVGWMTGGKLFSKGDTVLPNTPNSPDILPEGLPPVQGPMPEHLVTSGENTWKIIESNLDSQKLMTGMGEAARTHTVDALKDMFDNLSPDQLKNLGFHSGDADIISIGDKLNFGGVLDNPQIISQALFTSHNLSPEVITSILRNNATISTWFVAHHQELTRVFDSSVVEEVLRGLR